MKQIQNTPILPLLTILMLPAGSAVGGTAGMVMALVMAAALNLLPLLPRPDHSSPYAFAPVRHPTRGNSALR